MPNFTNFPAPNLPLTGTEALMIAQAQNGQLVTCTATVAEIGTGAIGGALSSPPPIGNVTPNTGAFTTLDAQTMSVSGNETVDGTLNVVGNTTVNNLTVEGTFTTPVPVLPAQAANTFFAGPASDGSEPPAFRDIVSADINSALTTPGPIGSGSPNVGEFTTVSASSEITANGVGTGLNVVNNAAIGGNLSVTGNSALSTVTSSGEIAANGAGTGLNVVNNASIGGALTVSGELEANGAGTGIAVANNATVGGTLSVTGASTLENVTVGGTLGVTGTSVLSGEVLATASGTGLSVANNTTIGGTLGVSGASTLASVVVTGISTLSTVNASGEITANGAGTGLAVTNNATVGGTLDVTGTSILGVVNASGGITTTASGTALSVANSASIGGTLSVTGVASVGAATVGTDAPQWQQLLAGNGATYHNVTTSRAFNTIFANSNGKPIFVLFEITFSAAGSAVNIVVNGSVLSGIDSGAVTSIALVSSFIVPAGETYEIQASASGVTLSSWVELF